MENMAIKRAHNPDFWRGKRVFITGHTGFKGTWLSIWLESMGAILGGYALAPTPTRSFFDAVAMSDNMESFIGDIRDLQSLSHVMESFEPEIVLHLAAQPLVRRSYKDPVDTYATNVMGTVNLLEASRKIKSVKVIINVTTDKCYENKEWLWGYREEEPMGGYDPYSSSKGCSELITAAYRSSYFCDSKSPKLASARAGNVIGGGDWAEDRLIPDFFRALENNESVVIRNPAATRPWQHVLEPLSGYLLLAEQLFIGGEEFAQPWNFGPEDNDVRPVSEIIEYIVDLWGEGASWFHDASPQPHEAQLLKLDISKAKHVLGWQPRWGVYKALESIVEWHKGWQEGEDLKALTIRQIGEYERNC
jgi:CDP-glucose 4,6-dehydratase